MPPPSADPTSKRKRGRRKAYRPSAEGPEATEAQAESPPPPPSGTTGKDSEANDDGSGSGASTTSQTIVQKEPDIVASARKMSAGQRVDWNWLVDSGASEDIASKQSTIRSRVLTKSLEAQFAFNGVGGSVWADDECRGINIEELGMHFPRLSWIRP